MTEGLFPHWWKEALCVAYIPSYTHTLGQPSEESDSDVVTRKAFRFSLGKEKTNSGGLDLFLF